MISELDIPFGVEVQDLGNELRITRRWFYWISVPLGLFALAWISLTLCKNADNLFNICNFLFLGLGLLALYTSVLSLSNTTEIIINQQELTLRHGPIPSLAKSRTIPLKELNQLFLQKVRMSGNISGTSTYWDLQYVDRSGKKRQIISTVPDWNQAQFIKQEIERFLDRIQSETE